MKINNLVCSNCLNIYRTRLKTENTSIWLYQNHPFIWKIEISVQTQSATETETQEMQIIHIIENEAWQARLVPPKVALSSHWHASTTMHSVNVCEAEKLRGVINGELGTVKHWFSGRDNDDGGCWQANIGVS